VLDNSTASVPIVPFPAPNTACDIGGSPLMGEQRAVGACAPANARMPRQESQLGYTRCVPVLYCELLATPSLQLKKPLSCDPAAAV
jgi:hypothetical protein